MIDGSDSNIKFRGAQDETHAQMNTITRLIKPENINITSYDPPISVIRFDDYGHVHIPDDRRQTIFHYLARVHQKYILDGIILNDLDMNCLKADLVKKVADFAGKQGIQLFVNPKHDRSKYSDIEGTAVISSLSEWCHLVEQEGRLNYWRTNLDREESLKEMAQLSFQYLGNFRYHIIECGKAGAILMAPHPEMDDRYAVYKVEPHKTLKNSPKPQLGCGKVMAAIFAMEFSRTDQSTKTAIEAFKRANATLACYRDMPWQRMPTYEAVDAEQKDRPVEPKIKAEPSKGMLFLPKERTIMLSDRKHETRIPSLFSVDPIFRDSINALVEDIQTGLIIGDTKSIIVGAPSGCGKSTILGQLAGGLGEQLGVKLVEVKRPEEIMWDSPDSYFEKLLDEKGAKVDRILIAIDEAIKPPMENYLADYGVTLLNSAHSHNVRFLFIDAGFTMDNDLPVNSEFTSRCAPYYLPGLKQRLMDIPYIVAGMVFELSRERGETFRSIKVEGKFLLTLINAVLSQPQLRVLKTWVREAYEVASRDQNSHETLNLVFNHLPTRVSPWLKQSGDIVSGVYEFYKQ